MADFDLLLGNFFEGDTVLQNFSNGLTNGLVTGYYGDVLTNLFNFDPLLVPVSSIQEYEASILAGGLGNLSGYHLDSLANTILITVSFYLYVYWGKFSDKIIKEIITSTIAVIIITYSLGKNTRESVEEKKPAIDTNTDYLALLVTNIFFAINTI